jgi:hypothetical protein
MNRALLAALLSAFLLLAGGCKSNADNKDAIRDGVVKHIAGMNGLNVSNMTVTVTKATFNGDTAQGRRSGRARDAAHLRIAETRGRMGSAKGSGKRRDAASHRRSDAPIWRAATWPSVSRRPNASESSGLQLDPEQRPASTAGAATTFEWSAVIRQFQTMNPFHGKI